MIWVLPQDTSEGYSKTIKAWSYSPDFGPTLAHEKIVEVHKIKISIWSVRRLMITNTLWVDKKIKRRRIYQLRERRDKEEELVQMDRSPNDWFEGSGPKCTLLLCVDDATSKIKVAIFAPTERPYGATLIS